MPRTLPYGVKGWSAADAQSEGVAAYMGLPTDADGGYAGADSTDSAIGRVEGIAVNAEETAQRVSDTIGLAGGPGTNLILNPSFEPNPGGGSFNGVVSGGNVLEVAEDTGLRHSGDQSMKVTATASPGGIGPAPRWERDDLAPNTQYTFSLWVWNPSGNTTGVNLRVDSNGAGVAEDLIVTGTDDTRDEWTQLEATFTTGPTVDASNRIRLWYVASFGASEVTWVDDMGLAEGPKPVTGNGDDEGWAWSGEPRNSTSIRDAVTVLTSGDLTASTLDQPVEGLVPDTLSTAPQGLSATGRALVANFATIDGTLPTESSVSTTSAPCTPARNIATQDIAPGGSGDPVPFGAWDGTLWGYRGFSLYSSTDNGRNWTYLQDYDGDPPSGTSTIVRTGDGEVIIGRGQAGLVKSTGWASDPSTATWTHVLTTSDNGDGHPGEIKDWGISAWDKYVTVAEYDGRFPDRPNSRHVWLSQDYGDTFTVIYNLKDDNNNDGVNGATSHLHCTEIDKWHMTGGVPRIWIDHHDYDNGSGIGGQRIRYSDDLGATWTTFLADTPDAQPTAILAGPESVMFGSDGKPDGVIRSLRTATGMSRPERVWSWRSDAPGLSFICRQVVRVNDSLAFFCFRSRRDGTPGVVVATDGIQAAEVYRTEAVSDNQPFVTWASVVNGEFVARDILTGTGAWDKIARGTPPTFGQPQASAVADATDEATAVTQLNALLASLRDSGVIEA